MKCRRAFWLLLLCAVLAVLPPACGNNGETTWTPSNLAKTSPDGDSTPTFCWEAAGSGSDIDHYTVSIDEGEAIDVGNVTEYTLGAAISDGSHTIVVTPYDSAGNAGPEATLTFVCDTSPPVVSSVVVTGVSQTGATITWTTDERATSQVEYGSTTTCDLSSSLDENLVTSHSVGLTDLTAGATIHYRVKSKDPSGNEAMSEDGAFSTCSTEGPVASDVAAPEVSETGVKITWTTDKPATSQVRYGLSTGYGLETVLDQQLVTSHTVLLTGLQAGTTYYYQVVSRDSCGKEGQSAQHSFTTVLTAEGLAERLSADLKQVCASTAMASGKIPEKGAILVVWADSAELVDDIQVLFALEAQPGREEDLVFVGGLTRNDVNVGSYTDGQPAYRIDYHVKLLLYKERKLVSEVTLQGSQPPYIKYGHGPGYGSPPKEKAAVWLAERTGTRFAGAIGCHTDPVTAVDFSSDGRLLASSSEDGTVCIWDVASGEKTLTLAGHSKYGGGCRDVEFSPDGTLVAFSGDSTGVRVYRTATATQVTTIAPCTSSSGVDSLAFSPDGGTLATAGPSCGGVVLWSTSTWNRIVQVDNDTSPEFVAFSPDGKLLASGRTSGGDYRVVLWDVQSRTAIREIPMGGRPYCAVFSPGSDKLAVATFLGHVTVWDVATGSRVLEASQADDANVVDFSPDGTRLAMGCSDGRVFICDATSGDVVSTVQVSKAVNTLDWSADGKTIAFAGDDCLVHLLDVDSGQLVNQV